MTQTMTSAATRAMTGARPDRVPPALPFWLSVALVPVVLAAAALGGWALLLVPLATWGIYGLLDLLLGHDTANPDPETPAAQLVWHRRLTLIWFPVQAGLIFGVMAWAVRAGHLSPAEQIGLFAGIGVLSGTIGITYAHELVHRAARLDRWMGDLLLATVLYSHFRTEHLLVHHVHVATPRDPATARLGQGFYRFLARTMWGSLTSALAVEAARQRRRGRPAWGVGNPFWLYAGLQLGMLGLAWALAGPWGLALFLVQALVAIWQLELVNYIEHYGLTRREIAPGRYEPVRPHHSWNATQMASNWLLINLQRHADHHCRPDRPFPLLQAHAGPEVPQLPYGYATMTLIAMIPPLWHRMMDPRVAAWQAQHYPETLR